MSRTPHFAYLRGDTLHLLPDPGAFANPQVRCAILWRNQATTDGTCPVCGAKAERLNREQRRRLARKHGRAVSARTLQHARDCVCGDDRIAELLRGEVTAP